MDPCYIIGKDYSLWRSRWGWNMVNACIMSYNTVHHLGHSQVQTKKRLTRLLEPEIYMPRFLRHSRFSAGEKVEVGCRERCHAPFRLNPSPGLQQRHPSFVSSPSPLLCICFACLSLSLCSTPQSPLRKVSLSWVCRKLQPPQCAPGA